MMQEQAVARLKALRQEYEAGQKMLADLEARRLDLQQTVLRISGAIQALEELLEGAGPEAGDGAAAARPPEGPARGRLAEATAEA
jgi:hypothetical protein